jgi:hypothetical protein
MSKSNIIVTYFESFIDCRSLHITPVRIEQAMLARKVVLVWFVEEQKEEILRRRKAFYSRPEAARETHRPIRSF